MEVPDHVIEAIGGHLSRKMLEHWSPRHRRQEQGFGCPRHHCQAIVARLR
jgi:hypothetical protein